MNGARSAQEFRAHGAVAGDGARLDEGGALPVLAQRLVIVEGGGQRDRNARRARIWPQTKVDAQRIAFAGALLQKPGKSLRHAHEHGTRIDALAKDFRLRVEEGDKVDVARIIQLARAMLAEREDHVSAILLGIGVVRQLEPPGGGGAAQEKAHGFGDGRVRECAQRARHVDDVPHAADVGERDEEMAFVLCGAQRAHHLAVVGGALASRAQGLKARGKTLLGIGGQKPRKPVRICLDKPPQVRRVVSEAQKQRRHLLALGERGKVAIRRGDEVLHLLARQRRVGQLGSGCKTIGKRCGNWTARPCSRGHGSTRLGCGLSRCRNDDRHAQAGSVILDSHLSIVKPGDRGGKRKAKARAWP